VRRKRSSSAPPTSHSIETNASLHSYLQQAASGNDEANPLPLLPAEQNGQLSSIQDPNSPSRAPFHLPYDQRRSFGVNTAMKVNIPTHESYLDTNPDKKKRVHPSPTATRVSHPSQHTSSSSSSSNIHMSLNTLLSQTNSYSKMKIFEHKMKQYDISHSGYINKSEFISSLTRSGIHLSLDQAHLIFESYAQKPKISTKNSISLSDHDAKAIPISEFIHKLQTRISTPSLQKKFLKEHSRTSDGNEKKTTDGTGTGTGTGVTPLQQSNQMNWKKLIQTLNSKELDTKRSLEFFKDLQLNHRNEIPSGALLRELHSLGVPLHEVEYQSLISDVKKTPSGNIDMTDFTKQLHSQHKLVEKQEQTVALMPSLEHTSASLSEHYHVMKTLEKQSKEDDTNRSIKRYSQQRKHFHDQQGKQTFHESGSSQQKRREYLQLFQTSSSTSLSDNTTAAAATSVPTCLLNGNSTDTKRERLRWFKMKDGIMKKRNDLLVTFGGPNELRREYDPTQIRDKFAQVGLQFGDEDFKLFHSYVQSSSNKGGSGGDNGKKMNFEQICDSLGVTVNTDSTRRSRKCWVTVTDDLTDLTSYDRCRVS
jgi:Ca2+-binding EF-hand superfamily protein